MDGVEVPQGKVIKTTVKKSLAWSGPKDQQNKANNFLSPTYALFVIGTVA